MTFQLVQQAVVFFFLLCLLQSAATEKERVFSVGLLVAATVTLAFIRKKGSGFGRER